MYASFFHSLSTMDVIHVLSHSRISHRSFDHVKDNNVYDHHYYDRVRHTRINLRFAIFAIFPCSKMKRTIGRCGVAWRDNLDGMAIYLAGR